MVNTGVTYGVIGIIVVIVLVAFTLLANRRVERDTATGDLVLRFHGLLFALMAFIAAVGALGNIVLAFFITIKTLSDACIVVGLAAFFLLLGGGMAMYFRRTRISVSDVGLVAERVFGRPQVVTWSDVVRFRYKNDGTLVLATADRRKVQIPSLMSGRFEFADFLHRCLPEPARIASEQDLQRFHNVLEAFQARFGR